MTVGSLFAGIGGFDLGLERAGMEPRWQVEIDPFASRILAHRWPGCARHGDVREVDVDELERTDLVCGGSPCQDVSVAGRRAGLVGERSGLFFEFIRVADAVAPAWLLFENVPGLLSSNKGADFATVLGEITGYFPQVPNDGWRNAGICVGEKRGAAWRVLDAQWFGVAQRRRRVFIVAGPGDGAGPFAVLFEPESCAGYPAPSREARKVAATLFASGAGTSRPAGVGSETDFLIAPDVAANITSGSHAIRAPGRRREDDENLVAHTLRAEGHDASEDGTGRGVPLVTQALTGGFANGGADDNKAQAGFVVPVAFAQNQRDEVRLIGGDGSQVGVVAAESGVKQQSYVAYSAIPIDMRQASRGEKDTNDRHTGSGGPPGTGVGEAGDPAFTVSERGQALMSGSTVRRLTPHECERLQGFPDFWTLLDDKTKDSPRYRALGNAVCVPVAEWIGRRIMAAAS